MDDASTRRRRRTLFNLLYTTDPAKLTPPAEMLRRSADRPPPERERGRPMRVSLMTLLTLGDESSAAGGAADEEEEAAPADGEMLCPVCAVRRKGAAFIPCGHTFCRLCSRVLVTGDCPACGERILDVLDIF